MFIKTTFKDSKKKLKQLEIICQIAIYICISLNDFLIYPH